MTTCLRSQALRETLLPASDLVNVDALCGQLENLDNSLLGMNRTMPAPLWARRGFQFGSSDAWKVAGRYLADHADQWPMAVYVHIPFCDRRCPFCDCYAIPLHQGNADMAQAYVSALVAEAHHWSRSGNLQQRPVSTVHFGGGTVNSLPVAALERIVTTLYKHLSINDRTEWALETTGSYLSRPWLSILRKMGFSRLHIGVQSLHDPTRKRLGRQQQAADVLQGIHHALEIGFVVSADMLYGVPEQGEWVFLNSLVSLASTAVDGISLYQLHRTKRNERFFAAYDPATTSALRQFAQFAAGHELLEKQFGFQKNQFSHFARPRDLNLYSRHAMRGEDLLALGASADGGFGALCYKHGDLKNFLSVPDVRQTLDGCLFKSATEHQSDVVIAHLLANALPEDMLENDVVQSLVDDWIRSGWLKMEPPWTRLTLTGSWAIATMTDNVYARMQELPSGWV